VELRLLEVRLATATVNSLIHHFIKERLTFLITSIITVGIYHTPGAINAISQVRDAS
jgi:hypothetical protein